MQIFRSLAEAAGKLGPSAVAIGNFDGVHLGHQALFQVAREAASSFGGSAVALTFEPHPGKVLSPSLAPRLLTTLDRKLELTTPGLKMTAGRRAVIAHWRLLMTTARFIVARDFELTAPRLELTTRDLELTARAFLRMRTGLLVITRPRVMRSHDRAWAERLFSATERR